MQEVGEQTTNANSKMDLLIYKLEKQIAVLNAQKKINGYLLLFMALIHCVFVKMYLSIGYSPPPNIIVQTQATINNS